MQGVSAGRQVEHERLGHIPFRVRAHICAIFHGPAERERVLTPFVTEGLKTGDRLFLTVNPLERSSARRWLESTGVDVAAHEHANQLELRDWTQTHVCTGGFQPDVTTSLFLKAGREARDEGWPRTRFMSDMGWVKDHVIDTDQLLAYEASANFAGMMPDASICCYDDSLFGAELLIQVMRTHPMVLLGGVLQENPFYSPPEVFLRELEAKRRARVPR